MLDIDRLLKTKIPDIAPVYGGVRGRTMSSRHQSYAWPALVEAGVKRIIDLRDVDVSNKLPQLCQEYGMEYFHYCTEGLYLCTGNKNEICVTQTKIH